MIVVDLRVEPCDVYIGRPGRGRDGYFGNPFRLSDARDPVERDKILAQFSEWFDRRVSTDAGYAQRVLDLRGKRCGCFCKPLPCHGDVMARWVSGALCCCCGAPAEITVNPRELDEREGDRVILVCGECGK